MKVAAIILASSSVNNVESAVFNVSHESAVDFSNGVDYPEDGKTFLSKINKSDDILDGRVRATKQEGRKIYSRKRFINSQLVHTNKDAWYYHYHNYGCYCVAPENELKNRGKPVDAIDSACKTHAMCYACAYSDFSGKNQECNPKQASYKYSIKETNNNNYLIQCLNPVDTCNYAACACDKALAESIGKLAMSGTLTNSDYRDYDGEQCSASNQRLLSSASAASSRGEGSIGEMISPNVEAGLPPAFFHDDATAFDFESELQIVWSGDTGNSNLKQCCGVYPQRFPYKEGRNHECCDVGKSTEELKPVGTC